MNRLLIISVCLIVATLGSKHAASTPLQDPYTGPEERRIIADTNSPAPNSFANAFPRWLSPTKVGTPVVAGPPLSEEVVTGFYGPQMAVDSRNTVYLVGLNNIGQLVVFDNRLDTRLANGFSMATVLVTPPTGTSIGFMQYDIAVAADGTAMVVFSLTDVYRRSIYYTAKGPGGWSAPADIAGAAGTQTLREYYTYPRIRVDANGNVHIGSIFTRDEYNPDPLYINSRTHRIAYQGIVNGVLGTPMPISSTGFTWAGGPPPSQPPLQGYMELRLTVPLGSEQPFMAFVWSGTGVNNSQIQYITRVAGTWSGATPVSAPGNVNWPDIAVTSGTTLTPHFVWFAESAGQYQFWYRVGTDPAATYGPPIYMPRIAIDSRNQVHVMGARMLDDVGISYLARVWNPTTNALNDGFYRQPMIAAPYNGTYTFGSYSTMAIGRNDQLHYATEAFETTVAVPGYNDHVVYTRTMEYDPLPRDVAGRVPAFPGGVMNAVTGNLHAGVSLFGSSGVGPSQSPALVYNSLEHFSGFIAPGWKLNYEIYLIDHWGRLNDPESPSQMDRPSDCVTLFFGDGRAVHFRYRTYVAGNREYSFYEPLAEHGFSAKLERLTYSYASTYRLIFKDGTVYRFNANGKIVAIDDPSGYSIVFTYNGAGLMTEIRDQVAPGRMGRPTTLNYEPGADQRRTPRLVGLSDPMMSTYSLTYDNQRLATLRFTSGPGTPTFEFEYHSADNFQQRYRINLLSRFLTPRGAAAGTKFGYSIRYQADNRVAEIEDPREFYLLDNDGDVAEPSENTAIQQFVYDETTTDPAPRICAWRNRRGKWTRLEVEARRGLVLQLRDASILGNWVPDDDPPLPPTGLYPVIHEFDMQNRGLLTAVVDRWGVRTEWNYAPAPGDLPYAIDNVQQVSRQFPSLQPVESFEYMTIQNTAGGTQLSFRFLRTERSRVYDPAERVTVYTYQPGTGKLLTTTFPSVTRPDNVVQSNVSVTNVYGGPGGELSSITDEDNRVTLFLGFDVNHGLPLSVCRPDGFQSETFAYDLLGNRTQHQLPNGGTGNENAGVTVTVLDAMHRPMTVTLAGVTTTYGYDLDSHCISVTPPNGAGVATSTTYDKRGFVSGGVTPDSYPDSWQQWVDANGNVRRTRNIRQHISNADFDELDRPIASRTPGATTVPGGEGTGGPSIHTTTCQHEQMTGGDPETKVSQVGPTNLDTIAKHDPYGRYVKVLEPDGLTETKTIYNRLGEVEATEVWYDGVLKSCTVLLRDGRGRVHGVRRQDGEFGGTVLWSETSYTLFNPAGFVEMTVGPRGNVGNSADGTDKVAFVPDSRQRVRDVQEWTGSGFETVRRTLYGDDDLPTEIQILDPSGATMNLVTHQKFTYTSRKEKLTVKNANNVGLTYTYDTHPGQVETVTDANGTVHRTNYHEYTQRVHQAIEAYNTDDERRREYVWENGLNTAIYVWNPASSAYASEFTMAYDQAGRLEQYQAPLATMEGYAYDAFGRQNQKFTGLVTETRAFNSLGRMTQAGWSSPFSITVNYAYDGMGNRTDINDGSLRKVTSWNQERGVPTMTTLYVGGNAWKTLNHDFDAGGLERELTYPDPSSTVHEWVHDENGRVTDIKVGGVTVSESCYRPGGWLVWTKLRNSSGAEIATTYHDYDTLGRHTRAVTYRASDGATLSDLRWEYDVLDRVEKIHYFHLGVVTDIDYNRRSEVVSEVTTGNGSGQSPPPFTNQYGSAPTGNVSAPSNEAVGTPAIVMSVPNRSASYTYDKAGNRTGQTIDGVSTSFTYNAASQLTMETNSNWTMEHEYDGRGNEVERTKTVGATVTIETFGYNYLNLMTSYVRTVNSSVTAQWQYDYWPTGERYSKTNLGTNVGQLYATHGNNVVGEYNLASGGAITLQNTYGQGLGLDQKSLRMPASGGRTHYRGDMVDTLNITLEDDGDRAEECVRDVWGNAFAGDTNDERYGFAQRENDSESGLVYMRHRMYDPRIGRFTQTDPPIERRSLSHYVYARNNPARFKDPTGLYEEDFHYYVVYFLGLAAGLTEEDSFAIAATSQFVDDFDDSTAYIDLFSNRTELTRWKNIKQKRFHFVYDPAREGADATNRTVVTEGNSVAQHLVTDAITSGDPVRVGLELHALADSYSHVSYVGGIHRANKKIPGDHFWPDEGHCQSGFGGHGADQPFRDIEKALRASEAVFNRLVEYAATKGAKPRTTFDRLKPAFREMFKTGACEEGKYNHEDNLNDRIRKWELFISDNALGVLPRGTATRRYNYKNYKTKEYYKTFKGLVSDATTSYVAP